MRGKSIMRGLLSGACLLSGVALSQSATAQQSVVMRRPLPNSQGTASDPSPTPTPTPTATGTPQSLSCQDGSTPQVNFANWTSNGFVNAGPGSSASCTAQKKTWYCMASYSCAHDTKTEQVADSVCQNFSGTGVIDPDAPVITIPVLS